MRTYIVTFQDGTEFPVTAPSLALMRRLCQQQGWITRYGAIVEIN